MAKEKACLNCKKIYIGDKCSNCGETPASDSFMKINSEGEFAIKTK